MCTYVYEYNMSKYVIYVHIYKCVSVFVVIQTSDSQSNHLSWNKAELLRHLVTYTFTIALPFPMKSANVVKSLTKNRFPVWDPLEKKQVVGEIEYHGDI